MDSNLLTRVPPHDLEIEMAVLGALMLVNTAFDDVAHLLHKNVFYRPSHQIIYEAIEKIKQSGEAIDTLTVVNQLKKMGELDRLGGIPYVAELTSRVASAANIETHSWILIEKHRKRESIIAGMRFVESLYSDAEDFFEAEDRLDKDLLAVRSLTDSNRCKTLAQVTADGMARLQGMAAGTIDKGAPNPFWRMGDNLPYFAPGDVTVVGADTSVGKSAFALDLLMGTGEGILFSFEMTAFENWKRTLAMKTLINSKKFNAPEKLEDKDWHSMNGAVTSLNSDKIHFCDDASYTVERIQSECRKLFRKHKYKIIVVDYLQIVTPTDEKQNENDRLQHISGRLKKIAMELETHFVVVSQFKNRLDVSKPPTENDLRGSGKIKQDANNTILLHRVTDDPELWNAATSKVNRMPKFQSSDEEAQFDKIIAFVVKARGSARFLMYPFFFHGATNQFIDPDDLSYKLLYDIEAANLPASKGDVHLLNSFQYENSTPFDDDEPTTALPF